MESDKTIDMSDFTFLLMGYAALGTGICVYAGQNRGRASQESYFIGNRTLGWMVSALTYCATTYSSFMMVGLVGLSYATGVGALIFEMTYLAATVVLLSLYGHKINQMGRDQGMVSPMELFSCRFGKLAGSAGALVSSIALIPYTAAQVIGLSIIFSSFQIDFSTGIIISAVLICGWSLLGGMRGVALTDAAQGLFMIGVAVAAVFWAHDTFQGCEMASFPGKVWTPVFFMNLTLPWAFFALTNPQVVQRLFIVEDAEGLKKMIILFALVGCVYTVITCLLGFMGKYGTLHGMLPHISNRDRVSMEMVQMMGKGLGLAVALSIVFASISTSNSIILTLSSMLTRDVLGENQKMWQGRLMIVLLTLVVSIFAFLRTSCIVELSVSTSRILICFLPLYMDLFHWKKGGKITGVLTIVGGAVCAVGFSVFIPALSSFYTLASVFALYAVGVILDGISCN